MTATHPRAAFSIVQWIVRAAVARILGLLMIDTCIQFLAACKRNGVRICRASVPVTDTPRGRISEYATAEKMLLLPLEEARGKTQRITSQCIVNRASG